MSDELKLGFHRLGEPLEDAVAMGVALIVAWVAVVWITAIIFAVGGGIAFAVMLLGATLVILFRESVARLATAWRDGRQGLERRLGHPA